MEYLLYDSIRVPRQREGRTSRAYFSERAVLGFHRGKQLVNITQELVPEHFRIEYRGPNRSMCLSGLRRFRNGVGLDPIGYARRLIGGNFMTSSFPI